MNGTKEHEILTTEYTDETDDRIASQTMRRWRMRSACVSQRRDADGTSFRLLGGCHTLRGAVAAYAELITHGLAPTIKIPPPRRGSFCFFCLPWVPLTLTHG
jgi:hypothetical protein